MTTVIFIHGAGASYRSFEYIIQQLPKNINIHFFSYEMDSNITTCIEKINEKITMMDTPVILIGHSLGGLIAAGASDNPLVQWIITISTPLGGILSSGILGYMLSQDMLKDLLPYSPIMRKIKERSEHCGKSHYAFVTTHGLTKTSLQESDGVVSVRSQTYWTTPIYIKVDLNHFEVLLDKPVRDKIHQLISE